MQLCPAPSAVRAGRTGPVRPLHRHDERGAPPAAPSCTTVTGMSVTYRTARAVMMVGSLGDPAGQTAQLIGPAHATLGTGPRGRRALCGTYVARDEAVSWPPHPEVCQALCSDCAVLARL